MCASNPQDNAGGGSRRRLMSLGGDEDGGDADGGELGGRRRRLLADGDAAAGGGTTGGANGGGAAGGANGGAAGGVGGGGAAGGAAGGADASAVTSNAGSGGGAGKPQGDGQEEYPHVTVEAVGDPVVSDEAADSFGIFQEGDGGDDGGLPYTTGDGEIDQYLYQVRLAPLCGVLPGVVKVAVWQVPCARVLMCYLHAPTWLCSVHMSVFVQWRCRLPSVNKRNKLQATSRHRTCGQVVWHDTKVADTPHCSPRCHPHPRPQAQDLGELDADIDGDGLFGDGGDGDGGDGDGGASVGELDDFLERLQYDEFGDLQSTHELGREEFEREEERLREMEHEHGSGCGVLQGKGNPGMALWARM